MKCGLLFLGLQNESHRQKWLLRSGRTASYQIFEQFDVIGASKPLPFGFLVKHLRQDNEPLTRSSLAPFAVICSKSLTQKFIRYSNTLQGVVT